jgi:hypothetical protein
MRQAKKPSQPGSGGRPEAESAWGRPSALPLVRRSEEARETCLEAWRWGWHSERHSEPSGTASSEKDRGHGDRETNDPALHDGAKAADRCDRRQSHLPQARPGAEACCTSGTLLLATKQGRCGNRGGSLFASARFTGFDLPVPEYADQDTAAAFFGHLLPSLEGIGPTFQSAPGAADCDADLAQGFEPGLINVGMADGSVRTISAGIEGRLWRGALLPDDGAKLSAEGGGVILQEEFGSAGFSHGDPRQRAGMRKEGCDDT